MEFTKSVCQCLRKAVCQTVSQEQTQELRLPDALPDIGRVLGCWGQLLIRSKEWRGSGMQVSGGVMAWILYAPEDGSAPRTLDCWIPVQMKWEFPQTQRDGTICIRPSVKGMDARTVSARKLMIRAAVAIHGEALEPADTDIFLPPQLPEDVALLTRTYPMLLPQEAGEKSVQLEDDIVFPSELPQVETLVHYSLTPSVTEEKILANRLVFRGAARLQLTYQCPEGRIHSWSYDVPFSQYTQLDRDYSSNAQAFTVPIVTALELEQGEDGKRILKAGIAVQYVLSDRVIIELVQDAYSPCRKITPQWQTLQLPAQLDVLTESVLIRGDWEMPEKDILDSVWYHEPCGTAMEEDAVQIRLAGQFQLLYQDENGLLQGSTVRTQNDLSVRTDPQTGVDAALVEENMTDPLTVRGQIRCAVTANAGLSMVTGLELGECMPPDPKRPSLVLRRAGQDDLWAIAKSCGSTVEAIRAANGLELEPEPDQMLLIPVR